MASISEGMNSKLDILIEVQRETLDAIKRLADTQEIRLDHVEKEIKDIWKEFEKHSESRRIIYDKLEQQSRTCAGRHGLIDEYLAYELVGRRYRLQRDRKSVV